jgi:hypothetical protein
MNTNQPGNKFKTKQNIFKKWWAEQLILQPPKDPRYILSDSFACFAIVVSLLFFYLQASITDTMSWVLLAISLLFALFLLSVACVDKRRHPQCHLYSSWFDDKICIPWAFILTPIITFLRLAFLYRSTLSASGHSTQIDLLFGFLGLYFVAYIIIYFIVSIKTVMNYRKRRRDETLRDMVMSGLLFVLIIMLIDFLTLTSVETTEKFRYLGILIVTSIPLFFSIHTTIRPLSLCSLLISSVSLIFMIAAIVLLFTGGLWVSFTLLAVAFAILGAGVYFAAINKNTQQP